MGKVSRVKYLKRPFEYTLGTGMESTISFQAMRKSEGRLVSLSMANGVGEEYCKFKSLGQPLRAKVDQEAIAMKEYSAFPKAPALLESHHQIVSCHSKDILCRVLPLGRQAAGVFYCNSRLDR